MNKTADAIVVGLGAMGSAATYQIAKSGKKVIGIDQFDPPHTHGSSHGQTRITRLAIGEGEEYVPLVKRSHEIWNEIEHETREDLLTVTGGLVIGSLTSRQESHGMPNFVQQTMDVAKKHDISHEILESKDIRKRFPQFAVRDDENACLEHSAGFVRPEACIKMQLQLAEKCNALLQRNEKVLEVIPSASNDSVIIRTEKETYEAEQAVLTVGPWIKDFLPQSEAKNFTVYREVLYWMNSQKNIQEFSPEKFPIFIWVSDRDVDVLYGFPAVGGPSEGVKVATEQFSTTTTPESFNANVTDEEIVAMKAHVQQYIPSLDGECMKTAACKYTCTPDFGFVIDRLPNHPQIIVASPCSGHGFKHSAAIGESISQIIAHGNSKIDLHSFSFSRLQKS